MQILHYDHRLIFMNLSTHSEGLVTRICSAYGLFKKVRCALGQRPREFHKGRRVWQPTTRKANVLIMQFWKEKENIKHIHIQHSWVHATLWTIRCNIIGFIYDHASPSSGIPMSLRWIHPDHMDTVTGFLRSKWPISILIFHLHLHIGNLLFHTPPVVSTGIR